MQSELDPMMRPPLDSSDVPDMDVVEVVDLTTESDQEEIEDSQEKGTSDTESETAIAHENCPGASTAPVNEGAAAVTTSVPRASPSARRAEQVVDLPQMGSRPSSECPTEPAAPVQERLVWEEQIWGRLAYTETGSVGSLHLTVLPVEDGLTLADRIRRALWERPMANGSPALTMAKEKANCDPVSEFPIKPEESPLNCDTPIPLTNTHLSDLAPGINPAPGLGSVLIGRVLLPPADYKTPSGCRAVMPALRTAQMVLNVCTAETGRQGGYGLLRDEQGTPSVGKIRLPDGLNYDSPDDCKLAAHWFKLAELVIGERAEALSCGDPVPPVVGHAHVDLAREGRLFREPLQEGDSVTGMGKRLQGSTRARGRPRKRRRQW